MSGRNSPSSSHRGNERDVRGFGKSPVSCSALPFHRGREGVTEISALGGRFRAGRVPERRPKERRPPRSACPPGGLYLRDRRLRCYRDASEPSIDSSSCFFSSFRECPCLDLLDLPCMIHGLEGVKQRLPYHRQVADGEVDVVELPPTSSPPLRPRWSSRGRNGGGGLISALTAASMESTSMSRPVSLVGDGDGIAELVPGNGEAHAPAFL